MPLFAGRKMLYSLDRGRRGISPPSSIAGFEMFMRQETLAFIAMFLIISEIYLFLFRTHVNATSFPSMNRMKLLSVDV